MENVSEAANVAESLATTEDDSTFYRLCLGTSKMDCESLDDEDFKFLVEFSLHNVAYTVYQQLQNNNFFAKTTDSESESGESSEDEQRNTDGGRNPEDSTDSTEDGTEPPPSDDLIRSMSDKEFDKYMATYETKNKLRLIQVYLVVMRTCMPYYHYIGYSYYKTTIETRRENQVPIQPNDKCYSLLCKSIRALFREYILTCD